MLIALLIVMIVLIVMIACSLGGCKHSWGPISLIDNPDGYQYCTKCGKAEKPSHEHVWEIHKEYNIQRERLGKNVGIGDMIICRCKICGEIKHNEIKIGGT
jgi:hypothetical protein